MFAGKNAISHKSIRADFIKKNSRVCQFLPFQYEYKRTFIATFSPIVHVIYSSQFVVKSVDSF